MTDIKLSSFLKMEIKPFLYGAFLSRIMSATINNKKYFYAYASFRTSKFVFRNDFDIRKYASVFADELNYFSGYYNWMVHSVSDTNMELRFYIQNDLDITKSTFYKLLYQSLYQCEWTSSPTLLNGEQKSFIRGFMELRGSVDTSRRLIAQDYFYENKIEIKKAMILTDMMNLPIHYANFNARNLQPQFVSGEVKRNAQFRINAYFYASEIGFINKYKALIFNNVYKPRDSVISDKIQYFYVDLPNSRDDDILFIRYLNFFTNNIYEKNLTEQVIKDLRQRIGFKTGEMTGERTDYRSRNLIELFSQITPDKCAICGTTHTFINNKTGRQHFEIHHVISYHNGQEVDNIANLVKLCPTCHNMLKKNQSTKDTQTKAIMKILHEHSEIFEFTSSYLGIDDINELSEKIWSMLG